MIDQMNFCALLNCDISFCIALHSALEALINFAYSGRIQIDTTNVQLLFVGSSFLHLQVVKDACCDFMRNRFVSLSFFTLRVIAKHVVLSVRGSNNIIVLI